MYGVVYEFQLFMPVLNTFNVLPLSDVSQFITGGTSCLISQAIARGQRDTHPR